MTMGGTNNTFCFDELKLSEIPRRYARKCRIQSYPNPLQTPVQLSVSSDALCG